MKYIRTENGIFEVDFVEYSTYYHTTGWNIFEKEQIIAQANTIEELCDEFVIIRKEENLHTTLRNYSLEDLHILKDRQEHNCEVYGAIWTSKGLIYVAKMNEDGELVLIWNI